MTGSWVQNPVLIALVFLQMVLILALVRVVRIQHKTSEALRLSRERFDLAMLAVNDGIWDWDVPDETVFFDSRYYELSGYEPDEFPHRFEEFQKRVHPEDVQEVLAAAQAHLSGQTTAFDVEFRFLRKDGTYMWIRGRGKGVRFDREGRITRMIGTHTDITEKKAAEEELRKSRATLDLVLNTIPQSVFWKDRNGCYLGCNQAFARDLGLEDPQHILGKTEFDLPWTLEAAKDYRTDDREIVENGLAKRHILRPLQLPDGSRLWIDITKVPLWNEEGEVVGILGVYEDVTERKTMEEQLRQANLVVENSPAVLFRWKAEEGWPTLLVTENVAQFGYTREDLLSGDIPFSTLIHPEDLARVAEEVRRNTELGLERFEQIYRVVTREGTIRWVDDRTKVIRDRDGRALEYQGVLLDITDRKLVEADLVRSLNFQNALLDAIPTAVFYKDREGRYLGCNKVFTEIMGVTSDEMRGKTVQELWPGEMAETYHRKDLDLMDKPARQTYEYKVKDRNGLERPVIFTKDVFRDERGDVAGIVGAFLDITERRKAEEDLKSLNETLEQRILDRTRELDEMNANLVRANEELQTTLETLHGAQDSLVQSEKLAALGQLIAGIAHELNTPLGAIVSSNQSLILLVANRLEEASRAIAGLSPEVRSWYHSALKAALNDRALAEEPSGRFRRRKALAAGLASRGCSVPDNLLESLLDLRLDEDPAIPGLARGHPDFPDAVGALDTLSSIKNISDVIAVAADKCSNVVSALLYYVRKEDDEDVSSRVDIRQELESLLTLYTNKIKYGVQILRDFRGTGIVQGNRNQLNQVWMNLIQNALQAMEFKGILGLGVREQDGRVVVEVRDTGSGIPEYLREKIFEPFFTTKKSGEGTGLGLDICRKIVERHGGRIELESEPGATVFRVFLTAWKEEQPA